MFVLCNHDCSSFAIGPTADITSKSVGYEHSRIAISASVCCMWVGMPAGAVQPLPWQIVGTTSVKGATYSILFPGLPFQVEVLSCGQTPWLVAAVYYMSPLLCGSCITHTRQFQPLLYAGQIRFSASLRVLYTPLCTKALNKSILSIGLYWL